MKVRLVWLLACCGLVWLWTDPTLARGQDDPDKKEEPAAKQEPPATPTPPAPPADQEGELDEGLEPPPKVEPEAAAEEPEVRWPYQEPLFALYAQPKSRVRLAAGFANNPDVNSLAFILEGSYAFSRLAINVRVPMGASFGAETGSAFSAGDVELGVQGLIAHDPESNKHLAAGLSLIFPSSRIGEDKDLAALQAGTKEDKSNFGKRYLVASKPFIDMGLIPKLNLGLVPYVAFGQNLGRVTLQTDFGCIMLFMDNVSEAIYGTDRRYGFVLFYDLAAPVAITKELSVVAEFNATVALGGLVGTGFAFTLGARYTLGAMVLGLGVQLPVGVDNKPPDDDKMVGRYDNAIIARHHLAVLMDASYSF
jgi:hypothetical protein